VKWGGQGARLAEVDGPIHHPTTRPSAQDLDGSATVDPKSLQDAHQARTI
jgi:hypothetical protein